MFDRAEIRVRAGDGGDGAVGFRREKFVPFGGPDGGDGGLGGSVIIKADDSVDSLRRYRQGKLYRAENAGDGGGSKRHGRDGKDMVLTVPLGTVVSMGEERARELVADLDKPGEEVVVAYGGKGGLGNTHYVSSTNQSPRIAQRGEVGESKTIYLEMRLIADVGIIGYPNAGKSTLLAAASAARPKIASYPFTTLEPVLGVVEIDLDSIVLAEIPGLIEGAHLGRGLGLDFLRHAMRTKIFIHLIDGSSESPVRDMSTLNNEMALFDPEMMRKPQIVVLNKIDLPEVRERVGKIKTELGGAGIKAHYISAATGQGVHALMDDALRTVKEMAAKRVVTAPVKIFRPRPKESRAEVTRGGDGYVISAPELERIMTGTGVTPSELRSQLNYLLKKMGISRRLQKMGVRPGDKIRCGDYTWEW